MSWSYSNDPSSSPRDEVRFLIQDTDTDEQLLSNEEISYSLNSEGTVLRTAAKCCDVIALRYGREMDSNGETAFKAREKYEQYKTMAAEFREQSVSSGIRLFAGGILKSQKQAQEQDTDRVKPAFTRDLHKNPADIPSTLLDGSDGR